MKNKKLCFDYKKKRVCLRVKECSFFNRFRGLMFRRKENSKNLLFDFKKPVSYPIHSYFVFFRFVVLWFDSENNLIDKRLVKPFCFRIKPDKKFSKLVEIPLNKKNADLVKLLVGE